MKHFFVAVSMSLVLCCQGQKVDWQKTNNWQIYQLRGHGLFDYSLDTLKKFRSYHLNDDSIRTFLKVVDIIPSEKSPVWMGVYIASCKSEEVSLKIEVSQYGGFFYYEKEHTYYILPEEVRKEWLDYFSNCYNGLYKE